MDTKITKRSENKMKKREQIINSAEKLFQEKKFEKTSIEDVAKDSGLTIRTIYRYFISKEDLFFAVALEIARKFFSCSEEAMMEGKNALEKIKLANNVWCKFYFNNPGLFCLMNYQPDNLHNCELSPNRRDLLMLKNMATEKFADIVQAGKQDGSINSKLDTKKSVYFGMFASMGLLNLVSNMDKDFFWEGQGIDETEFLEFSMELLAEALA